MGYEVNIELTNMCMVADGTKVLVQNRVKPGWPGITFPGGHVEPGEAFTASGIREVKEETGLAIESPKLCGIKTWGGPEGLLEVAFLYKAEKFSGELKPSEEGEVFWAERDSLPAMQLASGMEETFRVFFEEDISELYYEKKDKNAPAGPWRYEDWQYTLQ